MHKNLVACNCLDMYQIVYFLYSLFKNKTFYAVNAISSALIKLSLWLQFTT